MVYGQMWYGMVELKLNRRIVEQKEQLLYQDYDKNTQVYFRLFFFAAIP